MRGAFLEDLTWPEAGARSPPEPSSCCPWGRGQGARALICRSGRTTWSPASSDAAWPRRCRSSVAPVVSFGYYPAFVHYPGSQHLRAETFMALLTDILAGFVGQGARRLAVINTGVSTEAPLRIVVRDFYATHGVACAVADLATLGRAIKPRLQQKLGGHADELETSLVLAIEPARCGWSRPSRTTVTSRTRPATVFYPARRLRRRPGIRPRLEPDGRARRSRRCDARDRRGGAPGDHPRAGRRPGRPLPGSPDGVGGRPPGRIHLFNPTWHPHARFRTPSWGSPHPCSGWA
jgi:creatinine amidohydrolase